MSNTNSSSAGGIGLAGALGIAFIVLKLVGVIAWPWVWVLAPLWGPFALIAAILVVVFIAAGIKVAVSSKSSK